MVNRPALEALLFTSAEAAALAADRLRFTAPISDAQTQDAARRREAIALARAERHHEIALNLANEMLVDRAEYAIRRERKLEAILSPYRRTKQRGR